MNKQATTRGSGPRPLGQWLSRFIVFSRATVLSLRCYT